MRVRIAEAGERMLEENDAPTDELMRDVLAHLDRTQLLVIGRAMADLRSSLETAVGVPHGIATGPPHRLHSPAETIRPSPPPPDPGLPPTTTRRPRPKMEAIPTHDDYVPSLEEDPRSASATARRWRSFAVMLGLFLGALDQTIVGPALPTIVSELSGNDYYVWAITIYLLTSTISVRSGASCPTSTAASRSTCSASSSSSSARPCPA